MISRARLGAALLLGLLALLPQSAQAAPEGRAWALTLTPLPAAAAPGERAEYLAIATNIGAEATSGPVSLELTLPAGLAAPEAVFSKATPEGAEPLACAAPLGGAIECTGSQALGSGRLFSVLIRGQATGSPGEELQASAAIEGGGASGVSATATTQIGSQAAPFDFLAGFAAPASEGDGAPATLAGSHPYQLTVDLGFPTRNLGAELGNSGHPRDVRVDLPRGLLGDPAATPVLCTEAELTSELFPGCPSASQVGLADLTTQIKDPGTATNPLYNMVPPPGAVAAFGFDALGVGIFVHLLFGVRTDGDYGAYGATKDILAIGAHPIFNFQVQTWGDPSGASHDAIRGVKERQKTPLLSLPVECSGAPPLFKATADSWEQPGLFHETGYESADLQGNPVSIEGCGELEYEPQIEARPTTNATDSPSGLDVALRQPQPAPHEEPLTGRATAALKDAALSLPPGLVVNPSQAAGLDVCTESQIGFQGEAEGGLRFDSAPQSCPEAAKIGTLEASTPLLAQYNEEHEVARDPESEAAIPRPVEGSVYLAKPYENPFGSLAAVYFAIEDPQSGIVAKLGAEAALDPAGGQITTQVRQSPEVPIEEFKVHLFEGDRAPLTTPPACAPYTTTAALTPWSFPATPTKTKTDVFSPGAAPGGAPCPQSEAQMPNAPDLEAGTADPRAATYSPLLFKVRRDDGSQRLSRLEATLPEGLLAKIAGVRKCPQEGIEKAKAREAPNQGALELADPSCPASSELGTLSVAVGSGPHPYRTTGRAYLAGPYKDAPLSIAIIAPAVAGPFDLGTVLNRTSLYLDPESARARALTDPLPQIIDGVPIDLRSAVLHIERPGFALNPTSCDEERFEGTATSSLGQTAPLTERFQVGGCAALPFKPKLKARLIGPTHRGAHPKLRTIVTARPGEANTARISFALPHTEFIDQAHFRTICTRVQFAAKACPKGAIYGHAKVFTPLLDAPLEGPIYLRSSTHKLPDAVFALHGPPSEPVEIDLIGRVDSVKGGVRFTFENVPDAPFTRAVVIAQGAKKGLFQNSTNICAKTPRATLKLDGQNGKTHDTRPALRAKCPKRHRRKGHHRRRSSRG